MKSIGIQNDYEIFTFLLYNFQRIIVSVSKNDVTRMRNSPQT